MSLHPLVAYTDGGCRGNPGVGAWAYLLVDRATGNALEQSDAESETTNNRMELMAVLKVLQALKKPGMQIEIRSDSKYTIDCCSKWMQGWKARGWTRKGGALKNVDILKELDAALALHRVAFTWVKGHAGEEGNERVDALLNAAMDRQQAGDTTAYHQRRHWQL